MNRVFKTIWIYRYGNIGMVICCGINVYLFDDLWVKILWGCYALVWAFKFFINMNTKVYMQISEGQMTIYEGKKSALFLSQISNISR